MKTPKETKHQLESQFVHEHLVNGSILCLFDPEHGGGHCRIVYIAVVMQQIHSFHTKSAHQFSYTISFPIAPKFKQ